MSAWPRFLREQPPEPDNDPVTVERVTLDERVSRVRRANNRVVQCEAELARAQEELERTRLEFAEAVYDVMPELRGKR